MTHSNFSIRFACILVSILMLGFIYFCLDALNMYKVNKCHDILCMRRCVVVFLPHFLQAFHHSWGSWGPFHDFQRFFHRNSNSVEISFCSHPSYNQVIAMKFYTWHDSCAVVACAKFCSDIVPYSGVTLRLILSNLNYDGKIVYELGPWALFQC